ncbi:MAG: SDR family oxidoreductase [Chromatiales bacterium]|jgi:NAD(P)-dependent dehydrogenase (short-subunit alcohol dehydrogenase family)
MKQRQLLVTGCSRGIGLAITNRLLAGGHRVVGISRLSPGIDSDRFSHAQLDLSDLDTLPNALREVSKQHPDIDAVVLNAGSGRFGSLEEFSASQIRQLVDLNLTSQVLLAREFLPRLKKSGGGDLVFIGSESALRGGRYGTVYAATKFGLRGLVQSLQEECSASSVRVGIVNPGMVNTSFFDELDFRPGDGEDQHLVPDDVVAAVLLMLEARAGAVIQEINLQPQKRVIRFD